jgi:hypothetical protein
MTKAANAWLSIDPALLRHQITVQAQSTSQDSVGQPVLTWTTVRTCSGGLNVVSMVWSGALASRVSQASGFLPRFQ